MPGKVYNRVEELIALRKRTNPDMPTSYRDIGKTVGMTPTTVGAWVNNEVKRFDKDKLVAWCDFLDCDLHDLLIYERE